MIDFLEKHRFFSFILLILSAIEIFYFSSIPASGVSGGMAITPIVYHIVIFFLFYFFLLTTIKGKSRINLWQLNFTIIISIAYAVLDEFHQSFIPGRSAGLEDVVIDSAGILFAVLIYFIYQINSKENQESLRVYGEEYENEGA